MAKRIVCLFFAFCTFCVVVSSCESQKFTNNVCECLEDNSCSGRFWVYFSDKGKHLLSPVELKTLEKHIYETMHPNSYKRRTKRHAAGFLELDEKDFPVFASYVDQITFFPGLKHSKTSKWFNSISVTLENNSILKQIAEFPFVTKIDVVQQYKRSPYLPKDEHKVQNSQKNVINQLYDGDLHYGDSYEQLEVLGVPALHLDGLTGDGVTVLILDSGFNLEHPAIKDMNIVNQHDFVNDDDDVSDQNSDEIGATEPELHGTATLSTLGGFDDGQHYGPAFGATFLLGKTESVLIEDPVEEDYFISAIEWGEELGTDVVSSSLGYQDWYSYNDKDGSSLIDRAIDTAVEDRGIVVVVSEGNEHKYNLGPGVPGDALRALSIGATYLNGDITYFSCQGPTIDGRYKPELCAPGYSIHVANWNWDATTEEDYITMSGTSFSCPLAAGVVALLLESHPEWRPNDIHSALMTTANQADHPDNIYGWGIINATAANNYQIPTNKSHEHGICDDFERCSCDVGYYGPYCSIPLVECQSYCNGGYCDDGDCHCDTRWEGKLCIGQCEANDGGCIECLQSHCGFCSETQSCVSKGFLDNCQGGYSETHCESVVKANAENGINVDTYFVLAVLILCFAVLLVASAAAFFFCIVRP